MRTHSYKLTRTWEDVPVLTDTGSVCRMSGHITVTARLRPSLKREDKSKLEMEPAICFSVSFFVIGSLVCFSRPQHLCSSCEPAVFCVECVFYIVNMNKAKSIFHHFFYCRKILVESYLSVSVVFLYSFFVLPEISSCSAYLLPPIYVRFCLSFYFYKIKISR